jgi:hypothetical protein
MCSGRFREKGETGCLVVDDAIADYYDAMVFHKH